MEKHKKEIQRKRQNEREKIKKERTEKKKKSTKKIFQLVNIVGAK
jgi:hypothetical protein